MKCNPGKCHLLVNKNYKAAIRIGNVQIENTKREKLVSIQFDQQAVFLLSFIRNI